MTDTKHNIRPMEPIETIDYLRFIPPEIHQESKDFVIYAASRPFAKVTCCPHCGSRSFRVHSKRKQIQYRCDKCDKAFISITGTPFISFRNHEKWESCAISMLSGIHDRELRMKVGTATQLIARERALEIVMQEVFPNLYQWWMLFRYQTGTLTVQMPPQVKVQYDKSQVWLQNLLSPKVIVCPYCQGQNCSLSKLQKNQTGYRCNPCQRKFSILAPTRFRATQRTSELQYIFNLILNGACNADIVITHSISELTIQKWRAKLMAQLQDLNLNLLTDWVEWKHYCRYRQILKSKPTNDKRSD